MDLGQFKQKKDGLIVSLREQPDPTIIGSILDFLTENSLKEYEEEFKVIKNKLIGLESALYSGVIDKSRFDELRANYFKDAERLLAQIAPKASPLPETPIGLIGYILNLFPKPLNAIVALCLLGGAAYVAYHYFIPPEKEKTNSFTKVYVSGRLYIDNGAPRINEVTRLVLRNMPEVNSTRLDATGKYTFQNVSMPENKKLLVEITFENGQTVPTEELSVGKVDPNDNTLYLDDINASRPKPAKSGKPATGWSIKIVNQNNLNGDNNANQK